MRGAARQGLKAQIAAATGHIGHPAVGQGGQMIRNLCPVAKQLEQRFLNPIAGGAQPILTALGQAGQR